MDLFQPVVANAASSYIAYDEYVLFDGIGNREVHADDGMSLEQFKGTKKMLDQCDFYTEENGMFVLPGETDHLARYETASEHSQKIIRTILKSIRINELRAACFGEFDGSNVRVGRSGKIKFRNVRILTNLTANELEGHLRNNYFAARQIIVYLFNGNPPEEIGHLLNLIQNNFEAREMYHIHASLVSVATYPALFKEMYDHVRFVLPKPDLRAILASLPYVDVWKADVGTNKLLQITFNFSPKSYELPGDEPNQICLNKSQRSALKQLGLTPEKQASLFPYQEDLIKALQFFDYLRNRIVHRMEAFLDWVLTHGRPYSAQGSELITRVRFPEVLLYLQFELFKKLRLDEIPIPYFY